MEGEEQLRENHPETAQGAREERALSSPGARVSSALLPSCAGSPCPVPVAGPRPAWPRPCHQQPSLRLLVQSERGLPLLLSARGGPGSPGRKPAHHLPATVPAPVPAPARPSPSADRAPGATYQRACAHLRAGGRPEAPAMTAVQAPAHPSPESSISGNMFLSWL